ncbi:MAG TPA: ABC transporter substrate-binding protein [Bacteroidales bacterium]|nr:ABC transporter substrate-binding protein [Bacteroidales bacterium]
MKEFTGCSINATNSARIPSLPTGKMKKTGLFLALLLIPAIIIAEKSAPTLRPVTLQLKWKHQFQFAGYYAAIEKGYFEEAGLKVTLLEATENKNPADAVFEGKAEFGICMSDILLLRAQQKKAVVLASIFQHSPMVLLGSKKAGIEHIQDLVGKRIAIEPNEADLIAYLSDEGVTPGKYKAYPHDFGVERLIGGAIDALSAYSTDELFALRQADFDYTLLNPAMGGIDFYGDLLFTSETLLRKDPRLVMKFRSAALKGWNYALDHPGEVIDLILNKYSRRHSREHLEFEAEQMKRLIMREVVEIGYSNPDRWRQILSIYQRLHLIDGSMTTEGLLYTDYLRTRPGIPWRLILVFSAIIAAAALISFFFYRTAGRLRKEMKKRLLIEQELSHSNNLFRSILHASPDGILLTDLAGYIRMASPSTLTMFGYDHEEELLGKSLEMLIPEDDWNQVSALLRSMLDGIRTGPRQYRVKRSDSSLLTCEANSDLIRDPHGEPTGIVIILHDIAERIRSEQKIKEQNEELIRVNAEKDKFFSILAHDLRSPFNGFLGLTEIIVNELPDMPVEEIRQIAIRLSASARNLYALLENLLEWSRAKRGMIPFNPEPFTLRDLIIPTLDLMQESFSRKNILISVDVPIDLRVVADHNMFDTIIRNLLTNAMKFTPARGRIFVSARAQASDKVEIEVRDTGIGMDATLKSRLFRITEQVSRKGTDGEASTGLGLLIVMEYVVRQGGSIRVESEEGKGSSFIFTLPPAV